MMKLRVIEVEAPAEEIASAHEILAALRGEGERVVPAAGGNGLVPTGLPGEVAAHVRKRAGNGDRGRRVESWITDVLAWGTTEAKLGDSTNGRSPDGHTRYVLMYNVGPHHYGAFAYVFPRQGVVRLRLTADHSKGFAQAKVTKHKTYGVVVSLMTDEGYRQALELAKEALAGVQPDEVG
jgi:hypothetical protein